MTQGKMRGWLYVILYNRFGLQYSRKRYFILEDNCLRSFKSAPTSEKQEPQRSAVIDSCIRVVDNGRERRNRKLFFIFTLLNTCNHNDQLKLGVTSSEEAARWIHSLQDAALNPSKETVSSERKWQSFSMSISKRMANKRPTDCTSTSFMQVTAMTSDVIAPSPWKIFGCENGLRLFKEAKDKDSNGKIWDDHPAIMAVGVIRGTSEAVFRAVMSLGASRAEWDFCFHKGTVVEHLDGHTDIIHLQLYNHWVPCKMKQRDMLLRRYWRREDDGTYVILYHSVVHRKCPPQSGYVRASLKSGGFVITPIQQGKECVVKHMLAADWKFWRAYLRKATARSITIRVLSRVAALRELFYAKAGNTNHEYVVVESRANKTPSEMRLHKVEVGLQKAQSDVAEQPPRVQAIPSSLIALSDAADEFYDVPDSSEDDDASDNEWPSRTADEFYDNYQPKMSSASTFVKKKLQGFKAHRKGYVELQETSSQESTSCYYGSTLQKDSSLTMPCSWAAAEPSSFLIRGDNYLIDNKKIPAKETLLQMVGADWLRSNKREDNLAGRYGSIIQKHAARGAPEFFFVVNIQVPGTSTCNLGLYYMLKSPLEETPILHGFVNGDDAYRNARFKLIPYISKGSWIVKQSVGKKSCLIGQALEVNYFRGQNYLEIDIDVGSSTVARGVVSLVLGYLNNLVVEMAFLIQGNTAEELPEFLLGTCRLNYLDASKTISTDSIGMD